jgi:hypothetical protein
LQEEANKAEITIRDIEKSKHNLEIKIQELEEEVKGARENCFEAAIELEQTIRE